MPYPVKTTRCCVEYLALHSFHVLVTLLQVLPTHTLAKLVINFAKVPYAPNGTIDCGIDYMRIERVRSSDAGKYKISTRNSEGEGHFSFRLKVKGVYNLKPHAYIQYMSIIVISCSLSLSLSLSLLLSLSLSLYFSPSPCTCSYTWL